MFKTNFCLTQDSDIRLRQADDVCSETDGTTNDQPADTARYQL